MLNSEGQCTEEDRHTCKNVSQPLNKCADEKECSSVLTLGSEVHFTYTRSKDTGPRYNLFLWTIAFGGFASCLLLMLRNDLTNTSHTVVVKQKLWDLLLEIDSTAMENSVCACSDVHVFFQQITRNS